MVQPAVNAESDLLVVRKVGNKEKMTKKDNIWKLISSVKDVK